MKGEKEIFDWQFAALGHEREFTLKEIHLLVVSVRQVYEALFPNVGFTRCNVSDYFAR